MAVATKEFLSALEERVQEMRTAIREREDSTDIRGTTYYVSASGNDENDGKSPASAWKTPARVSEASLRAGDGVLFCRGDVFRGQLKTKAGVLYGAYGKGAKPCLFAWEENLASRALWEIYDSEHHIWKYTKRILDVGTLVFDEGAAHSYKLIPSYIGGRFVCRDDESRLFDMRAEMERDLDIYWHYEDTFLTRPSKGEDFPIPDVSDSTYGELYLRCDRGNPGEIFSSIEALAGRNLIVVGDNPDVTVENLCLKYVGRHAIGAGGRCVRNLKVRGCEIGWIGGAIQHYFGTDPNYPEGGRGTVTRFGNGIEVYGGCDTYEVSDCYIYEVYDAAITHQVTTGGNTFEMKNIVYRDNLVENCVYSIEYFLDMTEGDRESYMENIEICGNILRNAGYGWGQQRHNKHTPAHIKGWSYTNAVKSNYRVHDNVFDRAAYRMLHLVAEKGEWCPEMYKNTYVQYTGNPLGQYGGKEKGEPEILVFDERAEDTVRDVFRDSGAEVYRIS
ncbi:MAG: hypothetical protein E7643_01190 [Ruminococcaceae bacterium]|nr:hypothetical protein [Oscillospiraceae bacterium]